MEQIFAHFNGVWISDLPCAKRTTKKTQKISAPLSGVWNKDVTVAVSNPHSKEQKFVAFFLVRVNQNLTRLRKNSFNLFPPLKWLRDSFNFAIFHFPQDQDPYVINGWFINFYIQVLPNLSTQALTPPPVHDLTEHFALKYTSKRILTGNKAFCRKI